MEGKGKAAGWGQELSQPFQHARKGVEVELGGTFRLPHLRSAHDANLRSDEVTTGASEWAG